MNKKLVYILGIVLFPILMIVGISTINNNFNVIADTTGPKLFEVGDVLPATTRLKIFHGNFYTPGLNWNLTWSIKVNSNTKSLLEVYDDGYIGGKSDFYAINNSFTFYDSGGPWQEEYVVIDTSTWSIDDRTISSINGNFVSAGMSSVLYYEELSNAPKVFGVGDILPATTQLRISWLGTSWHGMPYWPNLGTGGISFASQSNEHFISFTGEPFEGQSVWYIGGVFVTNYNGDTNIFWGTITNKYVDIDTSNWTLEQRTVVSYYETNDNIYWEDLNAPSGYSITFVENGGTSVTDLTDITQLPSSLPTTTRENYVFSGWWSEPDGKGKLYTGGETITEDLTLYAYWQGYPYDITFIDSITKEELGSDVVRYGDKLSEPEPPTKEGYTFRFWSLTDGDGLPYIEFVFDDDIVNVVYDNMTLYAIFDINIYTVKFYSLTYPPVNVYVNHGDFVERPIDPENAGYKFAGWYIDDEYKEMYDFDTPIISDINLYAKFVELDYLSAPTNVSFDRLSKMLTWDSVDSAIRYEIYYHVLVQGFGSEFKKLGESLTPIFTINIDFKNLGAFTEIKFKVKAIGDFIDYYDSDFSDICVYEKDLIAPIISNKVDSYSFGITNYLTYQQIINNLVIIDESTPSNKLEIIYSGTFVDEFDIITYGYYDIYIKVIDLDGNYDDMLATITIYDNVAPVIVGPNKILKSDKVTFNINDIKSQYSCTDNKDSVCEVTLFSDNDEYTGYGTVAGTYKVKFTATDEAGNIGYLAVDIIVDKSIPPVLVINDDITSNFNLLVKVNNRTLLSTNDFVNILKKLKVIDPNKTFEITWNVNNYKDFESVLGKHSMEYTVNYLSGESDTKQFNVEVIESAERIEKEKSTIEKIWNFIVVVFTNIWNFIKWLFNNIVDFFKWLFKV